MSNEKDRTEKEMKNLFSDPKFMRKAWQSVGKAVLESKAARPVIEYDKNGNPTIESAIAQYSYDTLAADLKKVGREPTQIELIMQCQAIKAQYDTGAAIFIRDTVGAKPVDESKADVQFNNQYEQMSDEELEMLAKYREQKALEANSAAQLPTASESLVIPEQISIDEVLDDGRQ